VGVLWPNTAHAFHPSQGAATLCVPPTPTHQHPLTWRAEQQHPGGRTQAHGLKHLRVADGLGDGKGQLLAHAPQRAHVLPADVGGGGKALAPHRRLHLGHRPLKVGHGDGQASQLAGGQRTAAQAPHSAAPALLRIRLWPRHARGGRRAAGGGLAVALAVAATRLRSRLLQLPEDALDGQRRALLHQRRQVSAHKARGALGHSPEVKVARQAQAAGQHLWVGGAGASSEGGWATVQA
jgi:hypothetical protein